MSRGRKPKSNIDTLDWSQLFNKNAGKYLQVIITELCRSDNKSFDSGSELLERIKQDKAQLVLEKKIKKEIIYIKILLKRF